MIAIPVAWWLMHQWLQQYVFRINISFWIFITVGFLILLLALLVVSIHTLKAALTNPVKVAANRMIICECWNLEI